MKNENGQTMTDKEILREACDLLASACELLFELDSDEGKASAFITDTALRYCSAIYKGDDPRHSEEFLYELKKEKERNE